MRRILLLVAMLLLVAPVAAQEATPDLADQNWCYNPDKWAGGCGDATTFESQWMWTCGWYMAGFDRGDITRLFIETQTYCKELLPPLLPPPVTSGTAPNDSSDPGTDPGTDPEPEPGVQPACYGSSIPIFPDINFTGLNASSSVHASYDGSCSGDVKGHTVIINEADVVNGNVTCQALVGSGAGPAVDESYGLPASYRYCHAGSGVFQ